jgi:hypothetical protein
VVTLLSFRGSWQRASVRLMSYFQSDYAASGFRSKVGPYPVACLKDVRTGLWKGELRSTHSCSKGALQKSRLLHSVQHYRICNRHAEREKTWLCDASKSQQLVLGTNVYIYAIFNNPCREIVVTGGGSVSFVDRRAGLDRVQAQRLLRLEF